MSEIENFPKEKEVEVVEKFKEILEKKPEEIVWVDEEEKVRGREEDVILALYEDEEKGLISVSLEKGMRRMRLMPKMKKPNFWFFNRSDIEQRDICKTTAEQLRDIVERHGKPTRILYVKEDWYNSSDAREDNSFYGIFSFSEIEKDLGL